MPARADASKILYSMDPVRGRARDLRVGLIGMGRIARYQVEAMRLVDGVQLVGAFDTNPKAVTMYAAPCRRYACLDSLVQTAGAEIIVISTPTHDHFHTASRLLARQQAVMIEKPICTSRDELRHLSDMVGNDSELLHAALHASFGLEVEWCCSNRQNLSAELGAVRRIDMKFVDPYADAAGMVGDQAVGLGSAWLDSGINALSVAARLADPQSMSIECGGRRRARDAGGSASSYAAAMGCTVDGNPVEVTIETDWSLDVDSKITEIVYSAGTVILDHLKEEVTILPLKRTKEAKTINLQNGLPRLTNHYVGVFRNLASSLREHTSNLKHAKGLHDLLFGVC